MSTPTTPAVSSGAGSALRLLLPAIIGGLVAGVGIDLLTGAVGASDIGGDGWSLRGNGALVVLFAGGTAVLAGGWTALALHAGKEPGWLAMGIGAGLIGLALGASQVLFLALFGGGTGGALAVVSIGAAVLWMLAAPMAAVFRAREQQSRPAWHLVAAVLLALALLGGIVAALPTLG